MGENGANTLMYALLLALPLSALIARRVPLVRTLLTGLTWAVLFGIALVVFAQRQRFDPYLARVTSLMGLSDQEVVGKEVRIGMSADGHFWAQVTIDGTPKRLLIDSGATITALSADTAAAAGLQMEKSLFPVILQTANGSVAAKTAEIGELRLGDIAARDLPVVVSPAFGSTDVLGMNFLSRLKSWRVEGRTLILEPHHPQDFT